jgi:hypothetical protein
LVANGNIVPIFEPVRVNTSPLKVRAHAFAQAGLITGLVMNPQVGELEASPVAMAQLLADMRAAGANVIPTLIIDTHLTMQQVAWFSGQLLQGNAIFIHAGLASSQVSTALATISTNPTHLFVAGGTSAAHQNTFQPRALLEDGFSLQNRNSAYPPNSFFSDLHLTHLASGFAAGFGDYSIVGDRYSETGGPAYAVAIHMLEDRQTQGIYCNHFLSTSNTTAANPAGKFGEALAALEAYSTAHPGVLDFSDACQEFLALNTSGHFPGLGEVKRISLQHHLELMTTLV